MKWIFTILLLVGTTSANCTFDFTAKQRELVHMAYAVGQPHDLGYTLAAITWQEGFVGSYVIRINPADNGRKDGRRNPVQGSYGVTMILLTTAQWLEGVDSQWQAKAEIVPRLMTDDLYSMRLSLKYLMLYDHLSWARMIARYNQNPAYLVAISDKVNKLMKCKYFEV